MSGALESTNPSLHERRTGGQAHSGNRHHAGMHGTCKCATATRRGRALPCMSLPRWERLQRSCEAAQTPATTSRERLAHLWPQSACSVSRAQVCAFLAMSGNKLSYLPDHRQGQAGKKTWELPLLVMRVYCVGFPRERQAVGLWGAGPLVHLPAALATGSRAHANATEVSCGNSTS
jgi:hypothetical protein